MWRLFRTDHSTSVFSVWNQWLLCSAGLLCLLFLPFRTEGVCPSSCTCTRDTVTCLSDGGDTEVPTDIPAWTSTLILHGRNISTLLSHNGIRVVEPYAFLGLSLRNLHRLELAGNGLKTIPLESLDIYNLHALVLINNSIENINRENITSLYQQRRTRVYLALNPFRCTCELEVFYYWLKNSSQCPDAGRLLCSEPEARRGVPVENLRGEDIGQVFNAFYLSSCIYLQTLQLNATLVRIFYQCCHFSKLFFYAQKQILISS
uniref:LRRCT domain-containing protein n=1 Tax=Kryptolebias marmoratus TaxID=37003 RepID=A0A3Q3BDV2_KRYMA